MFLFFSAEGGKRDAEYKLSSIVSSLRRTIGYGPRSSSRTRLRSRSPSPTARRRPISPTKGLDTNENRASPILRRSSPSPHQRSRSPGYDDERSGGSSYVDVADVDPEQIRNALREYVQNFLATERERDDCVGKIFIKKEKIAIDFYFFFTVEVTQLRRTTKELEDNLLRVEQRFSQLQKTLSSFEEGILTKIECLLFDYLFSFLRQERC
jgi:rootletin